MPSLIDCLVKFKYFHNVKLVNPIQLSQIVRNTNEPMFAYLKLLKRTSDEVKSFCIICWCSKQKYKSIKQRIASHKTAYGLLIKLKLN